MSEHTATVRWQREGDVFTDNRYHRAHTWAFDGGLQVPASSSPHSVRPPFSNPANIDPEEALVAAVSSCHMLWFLFYAAQQGYVVESYDDSAIGLMAKGENGKNFVSRVTLRPAVRYAEPGPTAEKVAELHHLAHESCDIGNSIKGEVIVDLNAG